MKSLFLGLLKALKLPVKLLKAWFKKRKKPTKRDKLEKKLRTHLWNFSPGRLKNVSWQKGDKQVKNKRPKRRKLSSKKGEGNL